MVDEIVYRLSNNETLERKYKNYKLKDEFKELRECYIKPDLLLIYQKQDDKVRLLRVSNAQAMSNFENLRGVMTKIILDSGFKPDDQR